MPVLCELFIYFTYLLSPSRILLYNAIFEWVGIIITTLIFFFKSWYKTEVMRPTHNILCLRPDESLDNMYCAHQFQHFRHVKRLTPIRRNGPTPKGLVPSNLCITLSNGQRINCYGLSAFVVAAPFFCRVNNLVNLLCIRCDELAPLKLWFWRLEYMEYWRGDYEKESVTSSSSS